MKLVTDKGPAVKKKKLKKERKWFKRKTDYGESDSGCDCLTYWEWNTVADLDAMQFSKRAVIVTFTVCGTVAWTLLLFETLGGWHSGREAVIMKHAREMAKCHVAWVSSGPLCFTQALYKPQVNSVLLTKPNYRELSVCKHSIKKLSGGLNLKTRGIPLTAS